MDKHYWKLFIICWVVFWAGCTQMFKPPADDVGARMVMAKVTAYNERLIQFKGLAKAQMISQGRTQSGRIAFAAKCPNQMRIELLNTMGGPITRLVGDGEYISIFSHREKKYYRIRQSKTALAPIIHLPMGIEDLQRLVSGRVPIPSHVFAQSGQSKGVEDVVLLKNRWHGLVAKLKVNAKTHQIRSMQRYDHQGELKYQIIWSQWKEMETYLLPKKVTIESVNNDRLILQIDRFWPNIEIPPSTFVLSQ